MIMRMCDFNHLGSPLKVFTISKNVATPNPKENIVTDLGGIKCLILILKTAPAPL